MTKNTGAILAAAAVLLAAAAAYLFVSDNGAELPAGFVQGNGRIEAEQVEIAPARAGRVAKVLAAEGSLVAAGGILVEMDTDELSAAHDRAKAEAALARQTKAEAEALVVQRQSEQRRAEHELERATAFCPILKGREVLSDWAGIRPRNHRRDPLAGKLPGFDTAFAATGGFKISFGIAHLIADALVAEMTGREPVVPLPETFRPAHHFGSGRLDADR